MAFYGVLECELVVHGEALLLVPALFDAAGVSKCKNTANKSSPCEVRLQVVVKDVVLIP